MMNHLAFFYISADNKMPVTSCKIKEMRVGIIVSSRAGGCSFMVLDFRDHGEHNFVLDLIYMI